MEKHKTLSLTTIDDRLLSGGHGSGQPSDVS